MLQHLQRVFAVTAYRIRNASACDENEQGTLADRYRFFGPCGCLVFASREGGRHAPTGLPGWQAFRVAACPVWPYEDFVIAEWYNAVLSTTSAVTTVLFVLSSAWVLGGHSRRLRRVSAWIADCAFIVNAHWVLRSGSDRFDLRTGYFLWWFSFLVLAIGLFRLSGRMTDENRRSQTSTGMDQ